MQGKKDLKNGLPGGHGWSQEGYARFNELYHQVDFMRQKQPDFDKYFYMFVEQKIKEEELEWDRKNAKRKKIYKRQAQTLTEQCIFDEADMYMARVDGCDLQKDVPSDAPPGPGSSS